MRINRNRCQQCRFKKCLAVGMSRDGEHCLFYLKLNPTSFTLEFPLTPLCPFSCPVSPPTAVRFGRIPKREKQRMLLEMQNAMNNMMSNNSQLHSMLHGHQTPPLPMEASDAGSSQSSSSESPSCSNPSSPQCPQDSESVVSMDTNSSSASSCASDSGEDEAVVTVTRQCQDSFAYGQPRSSRASAVVTPSDTTGSSSSSNITKEEQQQSWNCWNNNSNNSQHNSSYSSGHQVSNSAYREQREAHHHQQQLSRAPSGQVSEDCQRSREFPSGSSDCMRSRAHLVRSRLLSSFLQKLVKLCV